MTGGKRGAEAAKDDGRPISKRRCDGLQRSPRRRASVGGGGGGGSGSGSGTFNVGVANEPRVSVRLEEETERQMKQFVRKWVGLFVRCLLLFCIVCVIARLLSPSAPELAESGGKGSRRA